MRTRHPLRAVLDALVGATLILFAVPVSAYSFALAAGAISSDLPCTEGYWCPTAAENVAAGLSLAAGGTVAVVLLVVGGVRICRGDPRRRRAWLLAGAGGLLTLDLAYAAFVYAGVEGAFS